MARGRRKGWFERLPDMDEASARRGALLSALAATGRGDRTAFKAVYDMTSAKLFGVCLSILPDRQEAEETLQDVYVSVWQKAAQFDPGRASPVTWLVAVARNRSIDRLRSGAARRRGVDVEEAADIADDAPDGLEQLTRSEDYHRLARCLDMLEGRASWAIRSAFLTGRTHEELARLTDMPIGTIKSVIRRGLLRLRGCMEP